MIRDVLRGAGIAVSPDGAAHPLALAPIAWWALLPGEPPVYLSQDRRGSAVVASTWGGLGPKGTKVSAAAQIAFPGAVLEVTDRVVRLAAPELQLHDLGRVQTLALLLRNAVAGFSAAVPAVDAIERATHDRDGWSYGRPDPAGRILVTPTEIVFVASTRSRLRRGGVLDAFGVAGEAIASLRDAADSGATGHTYRFDFPRAMIARVEALRALLILHTVFGGDVQFVVGDASSCLPIFARNGYPTA